MLGAAKIPMLGKSVPALDATGTVYTQTSGPSFNTQIPGGANVGDLLLLFVASHGFNPSTPSGWTLVANEPGNVHLSVYKRVCQAGDAGTNVTQTISSAALISCIFAYRNASTVDTSAVNNSGGTAPTTWAAPTVTTTVSSCLILSFWGAQNTTAVTNPNLSRLNANDGISDTCAISEMLQRPAGVSATQTASSALSRPWSALTIAFR